jgi:hypothetical protein
LAGDVDGLDRLGIPLEPAFGHDGPHRFDR